VATVDKMCPCQGCVEVLKKTDDRVRNMVEQDENAKVSVPAGFCIDARSMECVMRHLLSPIYVFSTSDW